MREAGETGEVTVGDTDGEQSGETVGETPGQDGGKNYTYILRCADGTYYTGWTNDLQKRVKDHNSGAGAKYTKSRRPVSEVYFETHDTRADAMRREREIKKMTRADKEKLIREYEGRTTP